MLTKIISFQRWEPKAADKPALEREKSFRAVVAMAKKVESQSDKWVNIVFLKAFIAPQVHMVVVCKARYGTRNWVVS